ncbi:MAG: cupredoxin domain-containing protein [Actinomycetota bacterium]
MRWLVALLAATSAVLVACTADAGTAGKQVDVGIEHSRFEPATFEFAAGTTVTFVVRNTDPIDHEFILGDVATQERHEAGRHARHGAVPGEISVPAGSTRMTTYTFVRPGRLIIGCHLPKHYAYGMRADVRVT